VAGSRSGPVLTPRDRSLPGGESKGSTFHVAVLSGGHTLGFPLTTLAPVSGRATRRDRRFSTGSTTLLGLRVRYGAATRAGHANRRRDGPRSRLRSRLLVRGPRLPTRATGIRLLSTKLSDPNTVSVTGTSPRVDTRRGEDFRAGATPVRSLWGRPGSRSGSNGRPLTLFSDAVLRSWTPSFPVDRATAPGRLRDDADPAPLRDPWEPTRRPINFGISTQKKWNYNISVREYIDAVAGGCRPRGDPRGRVAGRCAVPPVAVGPWRSAGTGTVD
jgi:hypothetical protein